MNTKVIFRNEPHKPGASNLREFILGGQDGLVNVLGIIIGVAVATNDSKLIILSGLAAAVAESASMAAVAYTSGKAERDYYESELEREKKEMAEVPEVERKEIRDIYRAKGFRGKQLDGIVKTVTSDDRMWLDIMMAEELGLSKPGGNVFVDSAIVGVSALVGSVIPLAPFLFMIPSAAIAPSLLVSAAVLFSMGAVKAKMTFGSWWKSGLELLFVGGVAAFLGYAVGMIFSAK